VPDHTLLRMIGRGSYGDVWLGRNVMGTYRAVKVVYRDTFDSSRPYEREFAGIRKFEPISRSHEGQVQILHMGQNDKEGYFYYVMELADAAGPQSEDGGLKIEDGGQAPPETTVLHPTSFILDPQSYVPRTLQHEIETRGRLPFAECLRISLALTGALKHLHGHGLVHRDIKPNNIIFVNGIPKLADIGLVTESEATIAYVGAQGFMPPEGPGRPRGDLYSLGKVIYEMCTGLDRMRFPELPPGFGDWLDREQVKELLDVSLRACEPDPTERQASAEALHDELVSVQAGKSVRLLSRLRRLERNWRWAATVALILGVLGWFIARERASRRFADRESLMREAQTQRMGERQQYWASNVLQRVDLASRIRLDNGVRAEAVAAFAGLDTQTMMQELTDYGADHLVFDREGRRLLMDGGEKGQRARIWDTSSDRVEQFAVSGRGPVWFGQDGRPRLLRALPHEPGVYQVTSLEDGREVSRFKFKAGPLDSQIHSNSPLAVSADGSLAAAVLESVTNQSNGLRVTASYLAVWRTETGAVLWQRMEPCAALAFSPDGDCLAIGTTDGKVQVRSLPGWDLVAAFTSDNAAVDSLAFGRNPRQPSDPAARHPWLLAEGTAGGTVWIHRLSPPGVQAVCRGAYYNVRALAFAPDGMTLISSGRDKPVVWDVATGRLLLRTDWADFAVALALSPDGSRMAIGMQQGFNRAPGRVRLAALQPDRGVKGLRGLSSQSGKVAFSHDGQRLAALAHNWEVGIWNLASNRLEHLVQVPQGDSADNAALAFSRDDSLFAFATSAGARLFDMRTGFELKSWKLPAGLQEHLWFESTGRLFLFQWERPVAGMPGECVVRELSRTNYLEPLYPPLRFFAGRIYHSCLSSDGQVLAVCGSRFQGSYTNHVLRVLNPQTGKLLPSAPAPNTGDGDTFFLDASGRLLGYYTGPRRGQTSTRFRVADSRATLMVASMR